MAVTKDFSPSSLDLNGVVSIKQPTALVWGPDGRLYVTEVDGDVKVLTIAFGDKDPDDGDNTAQFYVTDAVTLTAVKQIVNHDDDGTENAADKRQVTGIDVTPQFDANGDPVLIEGEPAVTIYVTSSDSRIGAGPDGADDGLDTNSGVITKLTQTGANSWDAVDLVRGLARSEENHALNGLEVIQELDGDGKLVSERMIVANGGNANTGAPSNNFAGQQEQPYSAALLEVDLDMLKGMEVKLDDGRAYVYDLPTLNDPTRGGASDNNDPFGGNDGLNSAKLTLGGPVTIYSPGYRNSYDVEVTDDGRVFTYDNGANDSWGGRPIGEAGDDGKNVDFAQLPGYVATNLNNGDGAVGDPINLVNWNPSNKDQLHEATRSDDLAGRTLSAGNGGELTFIDPATGLEAVYGGHPNPTRAEGSRAGLLFSPSKGADDAFLLVSNQDSLGNGGGSDYDEVIAWLETVEADDARFPSSGVYGAEPGELTSRVLAVTPGVEYDIYAFSDGSGAAVPRGGATPKKQIDGSNESGAFLGRAGLPSDIADIVAYTNPIEGDYREAGYTDGAIDTGNGSINGMTEYTSTVFDGGGTKMSGALIAASLGGSLIVIGRKADGTVGTKSNFKGFTLASDRTVIDAGGAPLGLASLGDDYEERGLSKAFQGSIWSAVYKQNGPLIEIFQPKAGGVPLAGSEVVDPTDFDGDGLNHVVDPFEFSAANGYDLAVGQALTLDFTALNDAFPTSFSSTGFLGAALDGETPNRDARTADENFPADQQRDGLFDNEGNLIPGGNAPIFQIKTVKDGTAVGPANTVRDAMQTGFRLADDAQRVVATLQVKNWLPVYGEALEGQVTGLMFGDGTQSNFLRVVFGGVEGQEVGLEVGVELGDAGYTVLGTADLSALLPPPSEAPAAFVELRLEIANIGSTFDVGVSYRLEGEDDFVAVPLNGGAGYQLPAGVLRDVLTGDHTIGGVPSGAAMGIVAEDVGGDGTDDAGLRAIDFNELVVRAFGNEIPATTAAQVGASGTSGVDTVIYTGQNKNLAPLAGNVENFDGRGSPAEFTATGNALDNVFRSGPAANKFVTGAGEDVVRGTLDALAGDEILDFSAQDAVVVEGVRLGEASIGFGAGSAVVVVDGREITFSGPELAGFQAGDGPATFRFEEIEDGLRITLAPDEQVVYRVNAGSNVNGPGKGTIAATDGGPDWIGDAGLVNGSGPVVLTGQTQNAFSDATTDAQNEVDYGPGVDPGSVPWQLFVNERSDNSSKGSKLTYQFDVEVGASYRIDLFYTENWPGIFDFADANGGQTRSFDVTVEGSVPDAFQDLNPAAEAAAAKGVALPAPTASDAAKGEILGTALLRSHTYQATDGTLTVQFEHDVQNPKVNAIQLTRLGARPSDEEAPVVVSIEVENPQGVQDEAREATVVLRDDRGFEAATLEASDGSELQFSGIVPSGVSQSSVTLSEGGTVATLTYTLTPPTNGWTRGEGQVSIAAGAYEDAAGNGSPAASASFILEPDLDSLVPGEVVLAINAGPPTAGTDDGLAGDDKSTYGGAIQLDPVIGITLEADDAAYYDAEGGTQTVVDGAPGGNGVAGALDGSALHTARTADGGFRASYEVPNGVYVVQLWFAELAATAAGQRQGDYLVNGEAVALDFDAFAEAGADQPVSVSKVVTVTDGLLNVDVEADAGAPGYNAIVVYEAVEAAGAATVSISDATAPEGGEAAVVLSRSGDDSAPVEVTLSLAPGTASPSDYGALSQTVVTIPAGARQATVSVPIVDDGGAEDAETFTVSIDSVTGGQIGRGTATVTIAASDVPTQVPEGGTVFELTFDEAADPIGSANFDAVLGGTGALEAAKAQISAGRLAVLTSDGDLSSDDPTASKNDFVKEADVSSPEIEVVHLLTRFANPFDSAFLDARGEGNAVPNFLQQGIVVATGDPATNQSPGEVVKLVWGGNDTNGVELYSQDLFSALVRLTDMSDATVAAGGKAFGIRSVATVQMALEIDKADGTVGAWVDVYDVNGTLLGGVRPQPSPGYATLEPQALPPAVAAALAGGTSVFGVTSTDFDGEDAEGPFTATWDSLALTSPQISDGGASGDAFQGVPAADFSDDEADPTDLGVLPVGEAVLQATQRGEADGQARDYDYVSFTVAAGQQLQRIELTGYDSDVPSNGGFLALVEGGTIAPPPADAEAADFAAGLLLGAVYPNEVSPGADLLGDDGDGEVQGLATLDHDGPLGPGTYTLWFSQSGAPSTTTLTFETAAVSAPGLVSVAGAGTVAEAGDEGTTTLAFPLSAPEGTSGDVEVAFTLNGEAATQTVAFADGSGTLAVAVPNDDTDTGPRAFEVVLTGAGGLEVDPSASTATGTVTDDDGATGPGAGAVVFALNAGGGAVVGADGTAYEADDGSGWSGSDTYADGAFAKNDTALPGGDYDRDGDADGDDVPYATERFGGKGDGVMTYVRDGLAPGEYVLTLKFAEIFDPNFADGARVFDVRANGQTVVSGLDLFDVTAQKETAYDVDVPVTVGADGSLTLEFDASADSAKVSAIVLRGAGAPGEAVVTLAAAPAVEEGDAGSAALVFPLAKTGADGTIPVTYTVDGGEPVTEQVAFAGGQGAITVEVQADDLAGGDRTVAVALTAVGGGATLGAATAASGTVTEDDAAPAVNAGIPDQAAPTGEAFAFAVPSDAFADADSALAFEATLADGSPLPSWLAFADGAFSGTPGADDAGTLSIRVVAADGSNAPAETTFDLAVGGGAANTPPTAAGEGFTVAAGGTLELAAGQLLANDADADGDLLAVIAVGGAQNGAVSLDGGTVSFTPAGPGQGSFTYTVSDGRGGEATATVTVDVTGDGGGGETPLPLGQGTVTSYGSDGDPNGQDRTGPEGAEVAGFTVTLLGNAWKAILLPEPITVGAGAELRFDYAAANISEIVGIGLDDDARADDEGSAVFQIAGTQTYRDADQTYRSYTDAGTTQSFAIDLSGLEGRTFDRLVVIHDQDKNPGSSEGTFSNVRLAQAQGQTPNTDPAPADDAASVQAGEVLTLDTAALLANDTDAEGDALTVTSVSNAVGGTVSLSGDEVTFTPSGPGAASFDYAVSDGRGGSATATVDVTVTAPPAASDVDIDFSAAPVQSYGGQDDGPGAGFSVEDGGNAIRITGNAWKKIALPEGVEITADTVLRFDLTLNGSAGEILGIGLETDNDFGTGGDALYQLAGRQGFGRFASRSEFGKTGAVGETVTYEIPLGAFAGTDFTHLVLIADDDRDAAIDATFSNVALAGAASGGGGGQSPAIDGGALPDLVATEDQFFEATLAVSDPDTPQDALSFTYTGLPGFLTADGARLVGTPDDADAGAYDVTVTVADPEGNAVSDDFTLTVSAAPPLQGGEVVIEAEDFEGQGPGGFVTNAVDKASGGALIRLGAGQSGSVEADLGTAGVAPGTYDVAVRHFDESDGASTLRVLIERAGGARELLGEFTLDQVLPGQGNWIQDANVTEVVVRGVSVTAGSRLVLEGTAEGGEFLRTDFVRFTPSQGGGDAAPVFGGSTAFEVAEGTLAAGTVSATDPDGGAVSYAVAGGADGALFEVDAATGALTFGAAPDFEAPSDAGGNNVYEVVIAASDGGGATTAAVSVTVTDANDAPEALDVLPPATEVGEPFSFDLSEAFSDQDGDSLTYALVDAGGSGLSVSGGALAGAPTAEGTYAVTVSASDGQATTQSTIDLIVVDTPAPPVGGAAAAFAAQDDLFTGASYGGGAVGSARLEVMKGAEDIDASNFRPGSFQVTNTGDKTISAVFIDVRGALYPDSVFDPDGRGGDATAKLWAVDSAGGTGAYVGGGAVVTENGQQVESGYFLPGPDPLPNGTGTGGPSNGGFKGAMVKFDPSVAGGFGSGETVGFSGDMDPNSIAGLNKDGPAGVGNGATSNWDVGGISGHELIGSSFTVLFDDGTTATGELGSDGSASGSHALATQAAGASAPGLTVGGVAAGGTGTYGGGPAPAVTVTGEPGQTVRVTLTKGLDPVNNTTAGVDALVADRLARYDFEVSNNFDSQSVDVVIGADGTADLSGRFDFLDAPANDKPGFAGDDTAPLGFVAAVIDPATGLPLSGVTEPVVLTNQGGPVTSNAGGPGSGGGTLVEATFAPSQRNDDWETTDRGGSTELELGLDGGTANQVGIRFADVTIPAGSVIEEAFLRFEASADGSDPASFTIEIEDTAEAARYSFQDQPDDRTYAADEFEWSDVGAWTAGEVYETPDIKALLSQVVGAGGVEGADIAVRITGDTGGRSAHAWDSSGTEPQLVIVFADDGL